MVKIETLEIAGFVSAFKALRLSYGKEERSAWQVDVHEVRRGNVEEFWAVDVDPRDMELLQKLVKAGDEHAKVLRGVVVWARMTLPVYIWCELETYRAGHERLMSESTMHIDCKGLSGEELQKAKASISMGKELTKVDFFSYQCLRRIWMQRRNHRLPEWHEICGWIESLPMAKELITI
jgi:hypothetical protein